MKSKIYFFIGTKAQAIKCLPVIKYFIDKLEVQIVDSGQHRKIVDEIYKNLNITLEKNFLSTNKNNISSYKSGLIWFFKFLFKQAFVRTVPKSNINSLCVVHGDTVSTLLGLIWAKRNKLKILHLESGLTSYSLFNPFPEEIIRRIVSRFSDILICFDSRSEEYLVNKYSHKKKLIKKISENTIFETIDLKPVKIEKNLITVTMHRTENLISSKIFKSFCQLLNDLSKDYKINWYLHEPTKNYLKKYKIVLSKKINILPLLSHDKFVSEIKKSSFVITDGGSIQEECFLLNKHTVLWRKNTERIYATNNNMLLSKYNIEAVHSFINKNINTKELITKFDYKPSKEIYDFLYNNYLINYNN